MNRWIVYVEGSQHSDHGTFEEATTEAQGMAPATIQERRTGTTPGSRRRTWIVKGVTEDQPVYMGGQDPLS